MILAALSTISGPLLASNLEAVRRLARFKNLYAKADFIGAGINMPYPCSDLHDAALKVIDAYGPERCVWTSVYPSGLWTPKITYAENLCVFHPRPRLKRRGKTLDTRRNRQKNLVP
jgi:hypothetical protein